MPRGRGYGRRRTFRKRRRYRRRYTSGIRRFPYTPMLYRGTNRMELKFNDNVFGDQQVPPGGRIELLNGIPEGISANQRIGNSVVVKTLQVKMSLGPIAGATFTRVYSVDIIWDRQPNGSTPLITSIFISDNPSSFRQLVNKQRYKNLYSSGPFILGESGSQNQPDAVAWNIFLNMNAGVNFSGLGGTVASMTTGALWLVVRTDAIALDAASFDAQSRIRYNDGQLGPQQAHFGRVKVKGGGPVLGGYKR